LNIIRDCLDALLHPSARYDALTRARHRAFMAPRLLGSLAAFAAFPVYLAMRGAPTAIEVAAFAWLIAPILLSWFLSRTARYEGAHVLSSLALAALVMTVAMTTGGIESFAAVWLIVVPLEAALSASRRVVAFASTLALTCAALLIVFGHFELLPVSDTSPALRGMFMAFGVASATFYAAGLAFGAESLARVSVSLLYVEEDRYRLLARNMSDVISRHRRNGAVQFISPAVETMLGMPVARLLGHGLFDRFVGCRAWRRSAQRRVSCQARCPARRARANPCGRFHLGRDALPAAGTGAGNCCYVRSRSGRGDARRHRPQDPGTGA
jgi:two-component system, cell cycle sensor histidine kinase DivJ